VTYSGIASGLRPGRGCNSSGGVLHRDDSSHAGSKPAHSPVIFAGRDLEGPGLGELYFQDCESCDRGVRLGAAASAVFETFLESEGSGVF